MVLTLKNGGEERVVQISYQDAFKKVILLIMNKHILTRIPHIKLKKSLHNLS
ncbi:hypothetical protein ES705_15408 [subsurface metagenome]